VAAADEFTRERLGIEAEHRMNAKSLARTLLTLFGEHGVPSFVRHNDGPQSVAERLPGAVQREPAGRVSEHGDVPTVGTMRGQ
jgi:hypothetical protein